MVLLKIILTVAVQKKNYPAGTGTWKKILFYSIGLLLAVIVLQHTTTGTVLVYIKKLLGYIKIITQVFFIVPGWYLQYSGTGCCYQLVAQQYFLTRNFKKKKRTSRKTDFNRSFFFKNCVFFYFSVLNKFTFFVFSTLRKRRELQGKQILIELSFFCSFGS